MTSTAIRVVNPGAPLNLQQAVLLATKESRLYRDQKLWLPVPHPELLYQATALECAEKLLRADGVSSPTRQQRLGKLVLPFGQYQNAPFHWLVENDVGYMKYILDKHRLEMANPQKKGEAVNQWLKDFLTEYAESFPQVSNMLEANIDRCIYGQTGFEHHTFEEMWDLYSSFSIQKREPERFTQEQTAKIQRAHMSVTRWLNTPVTRISSVQMKRVRKYICDKKQQEESRSSQRPSVVAG
uniref:Uncharacterized protein n=1 Tax=Nothobranchius kadleci TaxID=1051664 RepID=A0A1A8D4M6_NOTKA